MNADVRVVIKVAPGYHTAEIPAKRGIPEGAHSSPDDFGLQTAGLPAALRAAGCGLMIGGERVASLLHMDDSGIFARDEADLRRELDVGFEWLWRHGHVANGEKLEFAALADHSRAPLTFDYVWLPSEADEPDIKRRAAALVHTTSGAGEFVSLPIMEDEPDPEAPAAFEETEPQESQEDGVEYDEREIARLNAQWWSGLMIKAPTRFRRFRARSPCTGPRVYCGEAPAGVTRVRADAGRVNRGDRVVGRAGGPARPGSPAMSHPVHALTLTFFGLPRGRASSGIEFSATLAG